jgi:hypothetical protein
MSTEYHIDLINWDDEGPESACLVLGLCALPEGHDGPHWTPTIPAAEETAP